MGKILYPVGTKVKVVKNLGDYYANSDIGKIAEVVNYTKNSENPQTYNGVTFNYQIRYEDGTRTYANVQELKRYRPEQTDRTATESAKYEAEQKAALEKELEAAFMPTPDDHTCGPKCGYGSIAGEQASYSVEEVDRIISQVLEYVDERYSHLENFIRQSNRDINRNTDLIAAEFKKVNRRFKKLNHDDD